MNIRKKGLYHGAPLVISCCFKTCPIIDVMYFSFCILITSICFVWQKCKHNFQITCITKSDKLIIGHKPLVAEATFFFFAERWEIQKPIVSLHLRYLQLSSRNVPRSRLLLVTDVRIDMGVRLCEIICRGTHLLLQCRHRIEAFKSRQPNMNSPRLVANAKI